uniref:Uncharacterized protein n=1 Tax=Timema shepardi TaxID=629360 RepID=A0A7R9ATR9_TIMSH|nr:unnamed protein product [Timema shepardi]
MSSTTSYYPFGLYADILIIYDNDPNLSDFGPHMVICCHKKYFRKLLEFVMVNATARDFKSKSPMCTPWLLDWLFITSEAHLAANTCCAARVLRKPQEFFSVCLSVRPCGMGVACPSRRSCTGSSLEQNTFFLKRWSHCMKRSEVIYLVSESNISLPAGAPLSNSGAYRFLLKMNMGGMYEPTALIQHTKVAFTPISPLLAAPTRRFPLSLVA